MRKHDCYGRKWDPTDERCKNCPGISYTGDLSGPERCVARLAQETVMKMEARGCVTREAQADKLGIPLWSLEEAVRLIDEKKLPWYPYLTDQVGKLIKKIPGGHGRTWRSERLRHSGIRRIPIGTTLVRPFKGVEYHTTCRRGYWEMDGVRYGSLTAVVKAITGHKWPGHAFFGVKDL